MMCLREYKNMLNNLREFLKRIGSKKLVSNLRKVYKYIFHFIYPKGHFKKFNFLNVNFLIKVDPYKNGLVDNEIFVKGVYEPKYLKLIKENLNKDDIFLDIGANIGQHSLFASKIVGNTGKIIAFEPLKDIYKQFKESIEKNNFTNLFIYNNACGEINKKIPIYLNIKNMGGSSLIKNTYNSVKDLSEVIEVINPTNILNRETKINFIKIDVEGYELEVLKGLKDIIQKFKPKILLEYSPYYYKIKNFGDDSQKILDFLFENNYSVFDVELDKMVYKTDYDEYINKTYQTNFFCNPMLNE